MKKEKQKALPLLALLLAAAAILLVFAAPARAGAKPAGAGREHRAAQSAAAADAVFNDPKHPGGGTAQAGR